MKYTQLFPWQKSDELGTKILIALAVFSLYWSITNLVPLSASMVISLIFIPAFCYKADICNKIFLSLSVMLVYFVISILIYMPASLLRYDFYRRDGNVFIAFAPLLILSLSKFKIDLKALVSSFIVFATSINIIILATYIFSNNVFFSASNRLGSIYTFLFITHNAAGGFLAVLSAFCLGYYLEEKKRIFMMLFIINIAGLLLTSSRGSILAFMVSFLIMVLLKAKFLRIIIISIIVSQVVFLSWSFINRDPKFLSHSPGGIDGLSRKQQVAATIKFRTHYLWPSATYLFIQSPIFGTGFGSYDDKPYSLHGIKHFIQFNKAQKPDFSDSHSHHSFLNVLAETGLVGFGFLMWFLFEIWIFIKKLRSPWLHYSLGLIFWINIISSLTEHRLFTPSQILPFAIVLGLTVALNNYDIKIQKAKE